MGTTLTGKRVQNTYDSLLKLSDNDNLTGVAKIVGDGLGNNSPIYLSTTQVGIGVTPSFEFHTNSHAKIGGNLIVGGNLTVDGTTTIVDSTVVAIGDNMIELAKDNVANVKDIGWYGTINSSGEKYVGMFYDASDGITVPTFRIGLGTSEPGSTMTITTKGKLVIGALDASTGVFSGQVTIPVTPSANAHAASKKYVDDSVDGLIDGSGTANDVAMWSDSDTLTDAPIAISGNNASFAGNISAVGGSFTDPVTIYDTSTTENPRLSVGRSSGQALEIDVNDNVATIRHKQDTDGNGGHNIDFVIDSPSSGDKEFNFKESGHTSGTYLTLNSTTATFTGDINATKASGDHKINPTSGQARFTIESPSGNGNNVYLGLKGPDTEWRWITNRGDLNGGNQGDLFLRENTEGVNVLTFETNNGNATFAGDITLSNDDVARTIKSSANGGAIRLVGNADSTTNPDRGLFLGRVDNNDVFSSSLSFINGDNATFAGRVDIQKDLRIRGSDGGGSLGVVRFFSDANNQLIIDTGNDGSNRTIIDGSGNITIAGDVFTDTVQISSGQSYNENIRMFPHPTNDYSSLVLGAVSGTSGTGNGQWTLVRYPATTHDNKFSIRHNASDLVTILKNGNTSFSGSINVGSGPSRFTHQQNAGSRLELYNNRQDAGNVEVYRIAAYNAAEVTGVHFYRGSGGNSGYTKIFSKKNNTSNLEEVVQFGNNGSLRTTFVEDVKAPFFTSDGGRGFKQDGVAFVSTYSNGADANEANDIGSTSNKWRDAYFSGNVNAAQLKPTNIVTNKLVKFDGTKLDDSSITDTGSEVTFSTNALFLNDVTIEGTFHPLSLKSKAYDTTNTSSSVSAGTSLDDEYELLEFGESSSPVYLNIKTAAHNSASFVITRGYFGSNTASIMCTGSSYTANGGYANIRGLRVIRSGNAYKVIVRLFRSGSHVGFNLFARAWGGTASEDITFNTTLTDTFTETVALGEIADLSVSTSLSAAFSRDAVWSDNAIGAFGNAKDLMIYHDGSNSYINENGTGSLIVQSSDLFLRAGGTNNTNNALVAANSGAVTLYHANSAKLATTSTGLSVSGHVVPSVTNTYTLGTTTNFWNNVIARAISTTADGDRTKIRVWSGSTYGIGMKSGYSYGHIGSGEFCMSFQMNDNSNRGFWWGDSGHSDAQGAMSLTTNGKLTVATSISVGQGESVTSPSGVALSVDGTGVANAATLKINNSSSSSFNHSLEAFAANLTNAESNILLFGKAGNTRNSGYIGYHWIGHQSVDNYVTFGHWGVDHIMKIYGSGDIHLNSYAYAVANVNQTGDSGLNLFGNRLGFDQSGTRSWTMKAANGFLNVFSGDSISKFNLAGNLSLSINGGSIAYPDTGSINIGSTQWRRLGRWKAAQGGYQLILHLAAGVGYNASVAQQGEITIILRTSNGSSSQTATSGPDAMFFSGYYYQTGYSALANTNIRVVQVGTTTYDVYMQVKNFLGESPLIAHTATGSEFYAYMDTSGNTFSGVSYLDLPQSQRFLSQTIFNNLIANNALEFSAGTNIPVASVAYHTNGILYVKGGGGGAAIGDDGFGTNVYCVDNGDIQLNVPSGSEVRPRTNGAAGYGRIFSDGNGAIYSANGDVQFFTNNSAYAINWYNANKGSLNMRLLDSGSLLIGTSSQVSTHKLTVNGKIGGLTFSSSFLEFAGGNAQIKANDNVILGFSSQFYVRQNGGVTINRSNTAATEKLDIGGNVKIFPASSSWAEGLSFSMPTQGVWGGIRFRRERANSDGNHYIGYVGNYSNDDLVFGSNTSGNQHDYNLAIGADGRVTFGTTTFESSSQITMYSELTYGLTILHNRNNSSQTFMDALFLKNINNNNSNQCRIGMSTNGSDGQHHRVTLAAERDTSANFRGEFSVHVRQSDATNPKRLKLAYNGDLTVSGDVVAFGSPSDKKLKENIKPINNALDTVKKLQGVTFDWKNKNDILDIGSDYGFIAQEVQKVLPDLVRENDNNRLSLRDKGIISVLVEAVKELSAKVEALENKYNNS